MDEQDESLHEAVMPEEIDYVSLGKAMKRIRLAAGKKQEDVCSMFGVSRSVYSKYESGKVRPNKDHLIEFAKHFHANIEDLLKKISIVIPDTSALLKNKRLLNILLEDYDQIVIPTTVLSELSYRKSVKATAQDRKTAKVAWQVLANIDYYITEYPERIQQINNDGCKVPDGTPNIRNLINDYKVIALAEELESKILGDVVIIHDDADFTRYSGPKYRVGDYIAKRSKINNYTSILDLDLEFDHLEYYYDSIRSLDINAYLPDGMTLLISTIKCNDQEKQAERGGRRIPELLIRNKVKFLIEHGADINRNDNGRYCLPPLAHSIQLGEEGYEIFKLLIVSGCDFNKAARDERTATYMKVGKLNEGNTPLMIACFHGEKKFVEDLCSQEGISLNQQDSNGYTALMKCAVQRYNYIKKDDKNKVALYEELYSYMASRPGVDLIIRDRNNHTADDWIKRGNDLDYKNDEIW